MRIANLIACLLLVACLGCGGGSPTGVPPSEYGPPWITLDENKFGSGSSGPAIKDGKALTDEQGQPVMKFAVTNKEFADLLVDIGSRFDATIVVRPPELASRGITIEVTGANAQSVLADVARQCRLELESIGEKEWRLALAGSDSAAEKVIEYQEE